MSDREKAIVNLKKHHKNEIKELNKFYDYMEDGIELATSIEIGTKKYVVTSIFYPFSITCKPEIFDENELQFDLMKIEKSTVKNLHKKYENY